MDGVVSKERYEGRCEVRVKTLADGTLQVIVIDPERIDKKGSRRDNRG